ncbi:MAG: sugar ABC transporter permease [Caldilinea sp. CFX5]|nr:sugar ABC transporter permease [Caldilinea sp. CFX5]
MANEAISTIRVQEQQAASQSRRKRWLRFKATLHAYLYLLPTLLGLLIFSAGAILASFFISFTNWQLVLPPVWIGLRNYTDLLQLPEFWQVLRNTVYYTVGYVPLALILPLFMALLVNQKLKGITFFRTTYFLPVVTSGVAIALVWGWMYNPSFGVINYLLDKLFGIAGPRWLADPAWAMPSLIIIGVWHSLGYNMVIYLAGLQGIPQELYEAARIDGAGWWAQFRYLTVPLITPTAFFILVLSIIGSFQVWTITYLLTQGGPAGATLTLSYYIYQQGFEWFHMGFAAALAYVLFAIVFVVTMIQFKLQKQWVFYH